MPKPLSISSRHTRNGLFVKFRRARAWVKLAARTPRRNKAVFHAEPVPFFRKKAMEHGFFVMKTNRWKYFDGYTDTGDHLVLVDKNNRPYFVLGYRLDADQKVISVQVLQREQPIPLPRVNLLLRYRSLTILTNFLGRLGGKQAKAVLGMHPSEYLMTELIYRNRRKLRDEGWDLWLRNSAGANGSDASRSLGQRMPIIDRFFYRNPNSVPSLGLHELSRRKLRVKRLLEIP